MTFKTMLGAASALALLTAGVSAQATNLVQNGGFETTTLTKSSEFGSRFAGQKVANWTTSGYNFLFKPFTADTSGAVSEFGPVGLWGPPNGSANGFTATSPAGGNFLAADPAFLQGSIDQTITGLVAGEVYRLAFDWAGIQQYGFSGATTEGWNVSLGSQTHSTGTVGVPNHGFSGWMHNVMTFTATGSTETLSFLAIGGPSGTQPPFALLDGVSLTGGVPEPATWGLMILGFGAIGVAARRRRAVTAAAAA
jgi:hypothetical protein